MFLLRESPTNEIVATVYLFGTLEDFKFKYGKEAEDLPFMQQLSLEMADVGVDQYVKKNLPPTLRELAMAVSTEVESLPKTIPPLIADEILRVRLTVPDGSAKKKFQMSRKSHFRNIMFLLYQSPPPFGPLLLDDSPDSSDSSDLPELI